MAGHQTYDQVAVGWFNSQSSAYHLDSWLSADR